MAVVRMMQMAVYQIVQVVAVRDGLVATVRTMRVRAVRHGA